MSHISFYKQDKKLKLPGTLNTTIVLRGALWNIRSAKNKLGLLSQLFSDEHLDFLIVVETWQDPSVSCKLDTFSAAIKDIMRSENLCTKVICQPRPDGRRGGGLALVFRSSLLISPYKVIFPQPSSFEFLCVKIKAEHTFLLICIYRPPNGSLPTFLSEYQNLLLSLSSLSFQVVIAGDYNIKINSDVASTSTFVNLISENNFVLIAPESPTHCLGNVLDFLVVVNSFQSHVSMVTVDDTVEGSDHYPTFFTIDYAVQERFRSLFDPSFCRSFNSMNSDDFDVELERRLAPLLVKEYSRFPDYLSDYRECVTSVLDDYAPLHAKHEVRHIRPPWMDLEYIKERALRKRLQRRGNKPAYNAQKRYCQFLAKTKQVAWNKATIDVAVATGDQKQVYKAVNRMIDKKKFNDNLPDHTNPLTLANSMNSFFLEKVQSIREEIPVSVLEQQVNDALPVGIPGNVLSNFHPTDTDELRRIIKSHIIKVGPGDVLTPQLIKSHLEVLLPHFEKLVNLSLSTKSLDGLKEAHIVPILKSIALDKDSFKNYRPVSLLSFISKLTERVVHDRINSHLTLNSLQSSHQYGYKKNHSVETLMIKLIDDILIAVDKKFGVVMLMVDLSAAFDTVDHRLLLNILQDKYRITGSALEWLKSFLTGRTQRVKVGGSCLSDSLEVLFGVPQGSILGPLLFNLYCSTLNQAFLSSGFNSMGYADDNFGLRLFTARTTLTTWVNAIPECIASVRNWAKAHFLKINSDKTRIIAFGNSHFLSSLNMPVVRSDTGDLIPVSRSIKLLGFHIDCNLNFDRQVSSVCSSVNMALKNIYNIRKTLDQSTTEMMVHSLITNKLDQCNSLFVCSSRSNLAKLQNLQNSALRLILRLPLHSRISHHMKNMHWLTVDERCHFKYIIMIFKCINNQAPSDLSAKIRILSPIDMTLDTKVFKPLSSAGRRAFSYLAPRYWNSLPREIRIVTDLCSFKSQLKHYLFDNFDSFITRANPYTSVRISSSQP